MRKVLFREIMGRADDPTMVVLTGDVGFGLLEPLQERLGPRFVNAGVAEQNMVGVAAGLAGRGFQPWVYSIAPFVYARPFEQVRNDVAFHARPVRLVGNGGGYGYGVHGPSHHAIEDYGVLLTLTGMKVIVPAFDTDIPEVVARASGTSGPVYVRLGLDECPPDREAPPYEPWRKVLHGGGAVLVTIGPLVGGYLGKLAGLDEQVRPSLWVVAELPVSETPPPDALVDEVASGRRLLLVEEHVRRGGMGQDLITYLVERGVPLGRTTQVVAGPHVGEGYGSQGWLRGAAGLDPEAIMALALDEGWSSAHGS